MKVIYGLRIVSHLLSPWLPTGRLAKTVAGKHPPFEDLATIQRVNLRVGEGIKVR